MDVTTLPTIVMVTSVVSIVLVFGVGRVLSKWSPAALVPALFALSAVLLVVEWLLAYQAPKLAAVLVYLQMSGLGPMLGSGFWLVASERFDPRTAKHRFGQIQGSGTAGGLVGGLVAERVAALFGMAAMLLVLAALNLLCAWCVRRIALLGHVRTGSAEVSPELAPEAPRSGLRVLAETPYLRSLGALVFLGTLGATLIDYVFKIDAVESLGRGENLLRFFAAYYAITSLVTFLIQTSLSGLVLKNLGLGWAAATPSLALFGTGFAGLFAPGLNSITLARGTESILRSSLFRASYELFYTPIPVSQKRAAKSIIDVGFDRLGDALGGGVLRLVLMLATLSSLRAILILSMGCSLAALLLANRLQRGYLDTLKNKLLDRALELELGDIPDSTTRDMVTRTLGTIRLGAPRRTGRMEAAPPVASLDPALAQDPELSAIIRLRSRDPAQVLEVLRRNEDLAPSLVPHVLPLLAWETVANDAIRALRRVAEQHVGELVDRLVNPDEDFAVRRRIARVFSACSSQRAADGLMLGLKDLRFEVRFHCGRSLAAILERNPSIRMDRELVHAFVLREVAVSQIVWEGRQLLDSPEPNQASSFLDEYVRDRAGQSLAHVFTLLSLVLPREPLQVAFRGLQTEDTELRGTALEYLEGVLPPQIRERLWPFLEDRRPHGRPARPREDILAELLQSNQSIVLRLEELRGREGEKGGSDVLLDALGRRNS
jgi:HEAT repeat protein